MDHRRQLPNIFLPYPGGKRYIINVCESPSGCTVAVVSGVTGPQFGTMSLGPSFLVGDGLVQEIWTTYMSNSSPGLRSGDSGSWVLDLEDPNDPKVVGQVIACSQGRAHVSLLTRDFANISAALPKPGRVGLPSPLVALLAHSNYLKRSNFSREQYPIAEALSVDFLSRFPSDPFATALSDIVKEFSGATRVQDLRSFSELLSECGRSIFDDPSPPLLELSSQFIRLRDLYRRYKNSPAFSHSKSGPSNPEDGTKRDPNDPSSAGMGNPSSNSAIIHMPHMPETMEATQGITHYLHRSVSPLLYLVALMIVFLCRVRPKPQFDLEEITLQGGSKAQRETVLAPCCTCGVHHHLHRSWRCSCCVCVGVHLC
ncbi:hypothetical protein B0T26DRAFT_7519 [Lasiosphaeria miniovina]|uniref:Uncharacterized protein n=1 Tax=Lasiosphaeria miniovina TaxID=1954250 RepID=A0AA40EDB0_9PEZI|nr:uncharacterized protein B0T26DRAFT_7519 [Lasiosphaeria miniovina]KAK0733221.1 hypothetical protein B0T26DRAFT_7519 [Lasiosphaeria miniovina]